MYEVLAFIPLFILVYLPKLTEVIGTQLVRLSIFAKTGLKSIDLYEISIIIIIVIFRHHSIGHQTYFEV